jgi:DNA-binding NtrC family response regulator
MQTAVISHSARVAKVPEIIGVSAWARDIRADIVAVSACPSNVLVTGPTGTGKEVIARAIHAHSPRSDKPLIPVDCAAVSGTLFASHLFGHVKGAFTGAGHATLGCFRAAHGGTIFLDEIGELEADMQMKLLRVLQQRAVVPIGSHEETPVDVRVIAATNRDLEHEVRAGRFREDLFYRLNVLCLRTIPLRQRTEDVEVLSGAFLDKLAATHKMPQKRLSPAALSRLKCHDWPGNVRELENVLERAFFFSSGDEIQAHDVLSGIELNDKATHEPQITLPILASPPPPVGDCCGDRLGDCCMAVVDGHWRTIGEVEREHIRRTLILTDFNQSATARLLNMERHQLARKIRHYDLNKSA